MMEFFKALLASKKFVALLLGLVANLLALAATKAGIPSDQAHDAALQVSGLVGTYILGQGIADHGKERVKIEIEAATEAESS